MINFLEKYAILFFAGLAFALLGCSFLLPASAQVTGAASLALILCAAISRQVGRLWQAFNRAEITHAVLKRSIAIEAVIILVAYLLIGAFGRWVGATTGLVVARQAENHPPGIGGTAGFLSAMAAAFAAGFWGWRLIAWAREQLQVR
jgi:hypothetical protein